MAEGLTGPAGSVDEFVAGLPKAELHVHMLGSASVDTVLELARRHPERGVPTDRDRLASFYRFTDFAHFIEVYIAVNSLVRSADDIFRLAVGVGIDLARQNVRYAEVTVTPDSHLMMGVPPDALGEALEQARRATAADQGVTIGWVFDLPGESGHESGLRTIEWVERWAPPGTVAFGLGGPEVGVPRPQFADVFARARALGLGSVPHAGETTGPATVWDALRHLGADRIGHGIASVDDPALLDHLAVNGITLEVCPTSNVCTRAIASLADHPLRRLLDAGVPVSLNSDDPGMFGTTLNDEYRIAHDVLGVSPAELVDLARRSVTASFAPEPTRRSILDEIDAYVAGCDLPG
ncbi:MAG: adenosine deaminase [Acidimicrobiia bacterium]